MYNILFELGEILKVSLGRLRKKVLFFMMSCYFFTDSCEINMFFILSFHYCPDFFLSSFLFKFLFLPYFLSIFFSFLFSFPFLSFFQGMHDERPIYITTCNYIN